MLFGRNQALKPCSIDESWKIMQNALVKVSNRLQEAELWPILVPICVENDLSWVYMCRQWFILGLYVSRITNLDHIWMIYDRIWSIRKGVRYGPPSPPWYKKNRLGSGVKVEISCPLSVWDLAQQTIGINLVALQHPSRVGGYVYMYTYPKT